MVDVFFADVWCCSTSDLVDLVDRVSLIGPVDLVDLAVDLMMRMDLMFFSMWLAVVLWTH